MKCICIGICQMKVMAELLRKSPNFTSIYNEIKSYIVYEITLQEMQRVLDEEIPTGDLVISQPISVGYRGTDLFSNKRTRECALKHNKRYITITNMYFTGYDPVPFQPTNSEGKILAPYLYVPIICMDGLINSDIESAKNAWNDPDAYSKEELERNVEMSLSLLESREANIFDTEYGIDIRISDYIREHFRQDYLFHTHNHPSNILLLEVAKRIFTNVGIEYDIQKPAKELLGHTSIPPALSVYQKLGMSFDYPNFTMNFQVKTLDEVLTKYKSYLVDATEEDRTRWMSSIKNRRMNL